MRLRTWSGTSRGIAAAWLISLVGSSLLSAHAYADEQRFSLGLRGVITAADGEPANDIPGAGVFAQYALNAQWMLGAAVDLTSFDVERPAKLVGIEQDPTVEAIDAKAEGTTLSFWIERLFNDPQSRVVWYAGVGLGAASIDVPDAQGPRADGGRFDIHTEADDELIASLTAGLRLDFGAGWFAEFALRADQHFADWRMTDSVTGLQHTVGDYFAWGGHVGLGVRW